MGSDVVEELDAARAAHARRDWRSAFERFTTLRRTVALGADDLQALSDAAWWLGRVEESLEAGDAAFRGHLDDDRPADAAMAAMGVAISLFLRGDAVRGSGWMARAARLIEGLPEGPAHGYLRYLVEVEGGLDGDDLAGVAAAAVDVRRIGREHDDPNLVAVGTLGEGRARVRSGDAAAGTRLLDEAMVAVLSGELDDEWAGNVYCHLMAACHELADVQRAREWTEATARWLSEVPAAAVFTGICRVHRSQVLQLSGDWDRAEQEAGHVLHDLADIHVASVAEAHYQIGELRRLRGDLEGATDAYGRARELGRDPQPGAALVLLARGDVAAAGAAIRTALHAQGGDRLARARLCPAQIEIALAAGDLDLAARACVELEDAATNYGTSGLEAAALHGRGAVALAEGRPEEALPALRAACRRWHAAGVPYGAARACALLGEAYEQLGDTASAASERRTAHEVFERLGADVDARTVRAAGRPRALPAGLTEREAEVLALVTSGRTNREVAAVLVLSEKTIARHLSNIFTKLGVATRTEAAAFAFREGIVDRTRG